MPPVLLSGGECRQDNDKLGALEQALRLWTGPVLEEFQGEEWARGVTARLTEIHAASVDDYVDQLISAHRETDAIAAAEAQIGQYPYRDRSRGLLIRALALAGRQADALRAFQTYRSLLVEGSAPSPHPRSSGPNVGWRPGGTVSTLTARGLRRSG